MKTTSQHENTNSTANEATSYSYSETKEIIQVDNTPFTIVRQDEEWFLLMGNYVLEKNLQTKEEALKESERFDWTRVMQVIAVMLEKYETEKHNINN